MKYDSVIFDLDGTIIDSEEGIIKSIEYALDNLGVIDYQNVDLKKFIGPPLLESFTKYFDMTEEEGQKAVDLYRIRYAKVGYKENKIYGGVKEAIRELKKGGAKLFVASSKPDEFVKKIIDEHGLTDCFTFIAGASLDRSRDYKEAVLQYLFNEAKIDITTAVMVGDRMHDINGAHYFNMPCIAVLYGFGTKEEFDKYGADYIVNTPKEFVKIVLEN